MFLGGLWHGASWNFALWGICHGIILALERILKLHKSTTIVGTIRTCLLVMLLWIFFRSPDLNASISYFQALLGIGFDSESLLHTAGLFSPFNLLILISAALIIFITPTSRTFLKNITTAKALLLIMMLIVSIIFIYENNNRLFIYFRF